MYHQGEVLLLSQNDPALPIASIKFVDIARNRRKARAVKRFVRVIILKRTCDIHRRETFIRAIACRFLLFDSESQ